MDIFATISGGAASFLLSEQRIADILLGDFDFAVGASIIELAERASVSLPPSPVSAGVLAARAFRTSRSIWRRLPSSAFAI